MQFFISNNKDDYDEIALEIGVLIPKKTSNFLLNSFSYDFLRDCLRGVCIPYFIKDDTPPLGFGVISLGMIISDWEFGKSYAKGYKRHISCPALYMVVTNALLDNYHYGDDPNFPNSIYSHPYGNDPKFLNGIHALPYDEKSRNSLKSLYIPLYIGKSDNVYERWFLQKHHRQAEIDFLSRLGNSVYLMIYLEPQEDYGKMERILINDICPLMNQKIALSNKVNQFVVEDPWL